MSTYVIAGASRGLGFEMLRQLSEISENSVIALVRNVEAVREKVATELQGRANVHIIQADMDNYQSLQDAVVETSKTTGGKVDYFIANAGVVGDGYFLPIGDLAKDPEAFEANVLTVLRTNALSMAYLFEAFAPLLLAGTGKTAVAITSAMGEPEFVRANDIRMGVSYGFSKEILNSIVAKFSAQYREQGLLFMGISPGLVITSQMPEGAPQIVMDSINSLMSKFKVYAPHWSGPSTAAESISLVLSVMHRSSISHGDAGSIVSHFGNKQWL